VSAQVPQVPFIMNMHTVNMTNVGTGGTQMLEIRITDWSTAAQRQALLDTVTSSPGMKGQDQLLKAMSKQKAKGLIRLPGWQGPDPQNYKLGWELRYAWHEPLPEGGERIVVGVDRQMSMQEIMNQPRSYDYPFTFVEIHMPKTGKGTGKMTGLTQIKFDKKVNSIVLEQYSVGPVHLVDVTAEASKK
jgi:hypothetical protein